MQTPIESKTNVELYRLATDIREACVQTALNGYENARMDGLCHEGAWECAIDAMRSFDLKRIVGNRLAEEATKSNT